MKTRRFWSWVVTSGLVIGTVFTTLALAYSHDRTYPIAMLVSLALIYVGSVFQAE